ncbi:microtubule-associated protein futsch-like [Crassostrea angulata]|uniref:microtubule-associated protein futsch-like n=1 Tax=Magallana angulata TaxID=2784310 RepID=UPI0022B20D70|nr:microtubule-associated protein futsch-like [Crassostrea angulata]
MEFPVEGNYTPNSNESECSISIPGIACNKESPRSFRQTPRITSPRDSHVQAFSAKRTSDTSKPTEELPSVEAIMERVCSQMCNDLRRSGVLKDEVVDTVTARVYSEISSRCFRRSTDQDGTASASGRSSANNGSRVGQNNGGKSSNGDRASAVSGAYTERSVSKLASSLNIRKEESRNSSKSNRVRSSASNQSRIEENDGRSPADGDRLSVVSAATLERSSVKSSKSPDERNERSSQEIGNSRKRSSARSHARSARSEIGSDSRSSSLVSGDLTRSGTPARGQRGTSANSVSSRGRVLGFSGNKSTGTPSPFIRQTSSPSTQSILFTPRSTESRNYENVQDRPKSKQSGSKQDIKTVLLDQSRLQNNASSTNIGKECATSRSNASHIPVRTRTTRVKDVVQVTRNEDKIRQASSPIIMYSKMNSPSKHFSDEVNKRKSDNELASETSSSSQTSMRGSSGRSSKIPIRSITPKVTEPATDKAMGNVKKISKEKSVAQARIENKVPNGIANKDKKKARLISPKTREKEEENTQMNALERRKAYEAKRKLERKGALAAKSTKKTEIATKKQISKIQNKDEFKNIALTEPIVSTKVHITEKIPCHNEDKFMYEDDFEPMEEEDTNENLKSDADNEILPFAPVSKIEIVFSNHDVKQASSVTHASERNPDNIPHARHVDMGHEGVAADCGRANPSSTHSDVDFGYLGQTTTSNVLVQSQSGYDRGYCPKHMHPSIAHVYDNLDNIPTYKKMKEKNRRKAGKIFSYADENEHVRSKPFNAKKKTTVGYVPGYGAVRVMKEDSRQTYPEGIKRTSNNTSFPVIENQLNHGRTQRPIVGYVPGYGPVRGPPVQVFPDVPSERVALPPLDFGQACNSNGDVKRNKKGRNKKRSDDLLENRARAKPFNTYVDEEASRRFERQYTRHR